MGKFILNGKIYTGNSADGFPPLIYSDDEREVGVWLDGKPLYEKTIDCGYLLNNATKKVSTEILNIDTIANYSMWGKRYAQNIHTTMPIPFISSSQTYNIDVYIDVQDSDNMCYIIFTTHSDRTNLNAFVTLQYTKTTDTAGSGYWATNGDRAIHYSTTEQVIGTWIDGKPLYEKTIYKQYSELTTYGIRKGFDLTEGDTNRNIVYTNAVAISASYGKCYLGCNSYSADSTDSNGFSLNMYYGMCVVSVFGNRTWAQILPNICATIQYTKTTD